jgi:hypothetical protein
LVKITRRQYDLVDLVKFLLAITIVAIHVGLPILKIIGRIGVPFFVIISSFLFFSKYNYLDSTGQSKYFRKFEFRIFKLYLAWQVLYLFWAYKELESYIAWNGFGLKQAVKYVLLTFVYRDFSNTGWGTCWYLFAMIYALPVFLLMVKYIGPKITLAISLVIELYYVLSQGYTCVTHLFVISPFFFPRVLIYIAFGYCLATHQSALAKIAQKFNLKVLALIFLILFLLENYMIFKLGGWLNTEEVFLTAPTALLITMATLTSSVKLKHSRTYRQLSTFVYTSQLLFINPINLYKNTHRLFIFDNNYIYFLIVAVCIALLYVVWWLLYRKCHLRILKYLV